MSEPVLGGWGLLSDVLARQCFLAFFAVHHRLLLLLLLLLFFFFFFTADYRNASCVGLLVSR